MHFTPRTAFRRRSTTLMGATLAALWALAAPLAPAWAADGQAAAPATTIYIVRHAEKADTSRDPELSHAGHARANTLAHVLTDAGLDAIFVTDTHRSRQTAAPTAAATGLGPVQYDGGDSAALAARIAADHAGQQVLVVGHSNTLDDIAAALGIAGLADLEESQFDRLYVVRAGGTGGELLRLRFGDLTP
jgi:broad specificity phosphatase PhoE